MVEDALSKAERYRSAANRYGEMAKQAEPGYLAEVFREIAARYVSMAEEILRWPEGCEGVEIRTDSSPSEGAHHDPRRVGKGGKHTAKATPIRASLGARMSWAC
jgi:hypothetical protein